MEQRVAKVRIAVVDDHEIIRKGLIGILSARPDFEIVAEGQSKDDALAIAESHAPDILLMDLGMPGSGMEALREIRETHVAVRCIILTVNDDAKTAMIALKLGARGYILKGVSGRNLLAAIDTVVGDSSYISPEFAAKLIEAAQIKSGAEAGSEDLTHRESQIIREVEKGLTNREVAERLNISEKTVKYYMTSLMQKYGVTNRVGAVIAHRKTKETQNARHH